LGVGDNCNCPDDTYVTQPSSNNCWTCALPSRKPGGGAIQGTCGLSADSSGVPFELAKSTCPDGFRLPNLNDILSVMSLCTGDFPDISCLGCLSSPICSNIWFAGYHREVWVDEDCGFSLKGGKAVLDLDEGTMSCFNPLFEALVVCMKDI
jgi:hypothetical protein